MGEIIHVLGEPVEIVVTSRSTLNSFCTGIQTCPPGGGPPPHIHWRQDEFFHVLEGAFEFFDGRTWTKVQAGQSATGMRGKPHAFRNCGTTSGRMMFVVTPGGLDEYFAEISPLKIPQDMARLEEINRMYGITILPPSA